MPQISVWECPDTKALFRDKGLYWKHLRERALRRQQVRRQQAELDTLRARLSDLWRQPSLRAIGAWIEANGPLLTAYQNAREAPIRRSRDDPQACRVSRVRFIDIRAVTNLPVTHHRPVASPDRRPGADYGLAGWTGRISFQIDGYSDFSAHLFEATGINTGCGGGGASGDGGSVRCAYDCMLFADDFPVFAVLDALARER